MAKLLPTTVGDVLILLSVQAAPIYAIGVITATGQQDFPARDGLHHEVTQAAALSVAKRLVAPGRRMFLRQLDTGAWFEIA